MLLIPNDSRMKTEEESYGKTFPGAAHGWFVFLKPLQPGNHTVYYQNSVKHPTATAPRKYQIPRNLHIILRLSSH